ncbi:hypothetical protein [Polynucleobacter sp. AP-Kolm-20A-A1]|uniref:hypothetical protein n=1 Tax=Polynucleobacter sp. AP-Kolm-20A-A1 TaxID=2081041 RepID=UPI001BFE0F00|nr:hypothetical protein [Polynucleobacter sp. AP-Kolm-20A-A1]QWE20929.1 hypothetical protein C2745_01680 [Polynucleobacter sp. AP-Kolm-20A-A1]
MKYKELFIFRLSIACSLIFFGYTAFFYIQNSYLPPPFVFHKFDSFMDFYNVMHWAKQDGIYAEWGSVYPPLNFLIMQLLENLFNLVNIGSGSVELRQITGYKILYLILIFYISIGMAVKISCKKNNENDRFIYFFIIAIFSAPFLFAIERGNLIILCLPFLSIYAYSNSQLLKAMSLAFLINLKPYFIIVFIIDFFSKNKKNNDIILLSSFSLLILIISGLILDQEYYFLPINLLGFASVGSTLNPEDILALPISLLAFKYIQNDIYGYSIIRFLGHISMLAIYFLIFKSIIINKNNNQKEKYTLILSIIILTNFSVSTGGYGALYYICILPILYKEKLFFIFNVIILFILNGIWDLISIYNFKYEYMNVYLSNEYLNIPQSITLGTIIRPIANFMVLVLFYQNIKEASHVKNI